MSVPQNWFKSCQHVLFSIKYYILVYVQHGLPALRKLLVWLELLFECFLPKYPTQSTANYNWNQLCNHFCLWNKSSLMVCLSLYYRSQLKLDAESSSVDSFGDNLKGLLLQPPCRGEIILGVDPGFTNGCKLAVISKYGKFTSIHHTCSMN